MFVRQLLAAKEPENEWGPLLCFDLRARPGLCISGQPWRMVPTCQLKRPPLRRLLRPESEARRPDARGRQPGSHLNQCIDLLVSLPHKTVNFLFTISESQLHHKTVNALL